MMLIQLAIAAILMLGGLAQTDSEEPLTQFATPIEGGCLARLIQENVTVQSDLESDDPNVRTPVILVRRRGSSRRFPDPNVGLSSSPEGKALYSNETTEVFESMNLTQVELTNLVRNKLDTKLLKPHKC